MSSYLHNIKNLIYILNIKKKFLYLLFDNTFKFYRDNWFKFNCTLRQKFLN